MRHHEIEIDRGRETFTIRNKYRFVRKIGSGAYGTVCSVVNIHTGEGKWHIYGGPKIYSMVQHADIVLPCIL